MASTLRSARVQRQDDSLVLPLIGEAPGSQPTVKILDAWLWILPVIAQSIDRVMSRKEAAIVMGMDEGQLSRQLRGGGHLSVLRLGALPPQFWGALRDELAIYFDLNDPQAEAKQAAELITRGLSMFMSRLAK